MSGQYDKLVKGATKPKHAPPKPKYTDPLIAATFSGGAYGFEEIARLLSVRLRDPNSSVVFKTLIVIHTFLIAGNQSAVLDVLSRNNVLGLDQVTRGIDSPQNLTHYSSYLERRLKTYNALKYDMIRDKAEKRGACNRLRTLTVDKGLLRETSLLQKVMDSLTDCKFYLDDTGDDVTMTALRLLVKDLLNMFQAVNEGVINVLEHYFEMSKSDAETALKIYTRFCAQTEKVVTYLSVAKKLANILLISVPNLRHAPVSLAGSLKEYLEDPNFEQNRTEYRQSKQVSDGVPARSMSTTTSTKTATTSTATSKAAAAPAPTATSSAPKPAGNQAIADFFESIESEQQTLFGGVAGPSQPIYPQQTGYNPFMANQAGFVQPQQTGYAPFQPQQTAMPWQQPQQMPFAPQQTGYMQQPMGNGFMQPQITGYNPFRQSIAPQPTGYNPFLQMQQQQPLQDPNLSALQPQTTGFVPNSVPFLPPKRSQTNTPIQPAAAPANAPVSNGTTQAPLKYQPTGSRNPFAPPPGTELPQPKAPAQPSMNAIAADAWAKFSTEQEPNQSTSEAKPLSAFDAFVAKQEAMKTGQAAAPLESQKTGGIGLFADVASSFNRPQATSNGSASFAPTNLSAPVQQQPAERPSLLTAQPTGYGGSSVTPFKPTSSFGTSLAESLPGGQAGPAQSNGIVPQQTGTFNPFRASTLGSQLTGVRPSFEPSSSFGAALKQQQTGQASYSSGQPLSHVPSSLI
ncbi:uncharacterized protein L969DRAFT_94405 [Mixia osmundae IAM 14324]|uniref:ENTH domain-containing protein n=1 Tax=Mixia osmundae (strain CBS 9802 / IAM 14324 / JCM 22182 / KY 12970) TaxID=764103 RepID=G7E3D7_MIXOS|nr:uncharacterized protein L969DRAFT_94405 [Mixia osmundae IAM 14324]KEI39333.1 hypothetical protein L969DRAFT_94405 [Mixia osmundae IAM 14324]GAA97347.1 hypothetical protein E5Q_04025 [Mixia osmundae IAM 14324]